MNKISVVVPCYNEEANIDYFYDELVKVLILLKSKYTYEIIFVNDGSKDNTAIKIKSI